MKSISKKNILSTENGVKSKKFAIGLRKSLKNWEPFRTLLSRSQKIIHYNKNIHS